MFRAIWHAFQWSRRIFSAIDWLTFIIEVSFVYLRKCNQQRHAAILLTASAVGAATENSPIKFWSLCFIVQWLINFKTHLRLWMSPTLDHVTTMVLYFLSEWILPGCNLVWQVHCTSVVLQRGHLEDKEKRKRETKRKKRVKQERIPCWWHTFPSENELSVGAQFQCQVVRKCAVPGLCARGEGWGRDRVRARWHLVCEMRKLAIAQLWRISWKHSARLSLFHTPSVLSRPAGSLSSAVPGPRAARLIKPPPLLCACWWRCNRKSAIERALTPINGAHPIMPTLKALLNTRHD